MKKIIFYTDTPIYGGAERHMTLLASNLDKSKYQVTLVCSNFKQLDEWCENFMQLGMSVIRLKVAHKHDPRHLFQLNKILQKIKPDLLHLHLWNPGSCRYALMLNEKISPPIVVTEHDPFPLKGLKKSMKKKSLKKIKQIICVSNSNGELVAKLFPETETKISVVHNGIDLDAFERSIFPFSNQQRNTVRHTHFSALNTDFVILSIAALHPRKGLKYLIEAMRTVSEIHPEAKLVIVGEGQQKKELLKKINKYKLTEKIILTGTLKDIPKVIKSSDLFVLPSIKEAFGIVLLEAMAAPLPIIASKVGGIPEIISDGKNGIMVEPANSEQLAAQILKLIENKPLAQKLSFVALHDVKKFSAKLMAKKTEEVYDRILSSHA